jgi:proline iminopeptidase
MLQSPHGSLNQLETIRMAKFTKINYDYNGFTLATFQTTKRDNVILVIHGGPGTGSFAIQETHLGLADDDFQVITWDQLGCGESDQPNDDSLWTVSRFLDELNFIVESIKPKNLHLIGRSWGGVLALEFTLKYPEKLTSLILGSTTASVPLMQQGFIKMKQALGDKTYQMMLTHEKSNTENHPDYQKALKTLMHQYLCRKEPWPDLMSTLACETGKRAMELIFGSTLFNCTGSLKNYDRLHDLHKIKTPTLVMQGEFDYISVDCGKAMQEQLPTSELKVIEGASHLLYFEDLTQYINETKRFLEAHKQ